MLASKIVITQQSDTANNYPSFSCSAQVRCRLLGWLAFYLNELQDCVLKLSTSFKSFDFPDAL